MPTRTSHPAAGPALALTVRGGRLAYSIATIAGLIILALMAPWLGTSRAMPVESQGGAGAAHASRTLRNRAALTLPAAAVAPVSAALGRDDSIYHVRGLTATNPAQRLSVSFTRVGAAITAGSAHFVITLRAVGRGSSLRAVHPATPHAGGAEVSYTTSGLRELWRNGPFGLEQSFVLTRRPAGTGALGFSVGLPATGAVSNNSVALPDGLSYTGLRVTDARGHAVNASLVAAGAGAVLIRVQDQRATYPLTVDPFVQQAQLSPADGVQADQFGRAVAASGTTIVVGALYHASNGAGSGAAYVFSDASGAWTQVAELTASDGAANDNFGEAVAVSGNMVAVGAPNLVNGGSNSCGPTPPAENPGAVYEFTKPASGWTNMTQTAKLSEDNSCPNGINPGHADELGYSVAIQSSNPATIVGGADMQQANNSAPEGAALVYTEPAGGWASTDSPNAALISSDQGNGAELGAAVAISGGTIVVGAPRQFGGGGYQAPGSAYVYTMPAGGWSGGLAAPITETAELTASDKGMYDDFGASVAASGSTVVVGAPFHSTSATQAGDGAVYVYVEPKTGWSSGMSQSAELSISDPSGEATDALGTSLGMSRSTIIAGTGGGAGAQGSGAAYVFTKPLRGWPATMTQTQELVSNPLEHGSMYGIAVGIGNGTIVVGAYDAEPAGPSMPPATGAAYAFGCSGAGLSKLLCRLQS